MDAKHPIIGRQPTSFARSATSFICAARGGNDVLASLEMMLRAVHANDVVPAVQMKNSKSDDLEFFVYRL